MRTASRRRGIALGILPVLVVAGAAGCSGSQDAPRTGSKAAQAGSASLTVTPVDGSAPFSPDGTVTVGAGGGTLTDVKLTDASGHVVPGAFSAAMGSWTNTAHLDYNTRYTLDAKAVDARGRATTRRIDFTTLQPTALVKVAKVTPAQGGDVGVGMPVTVELDQPVTDPAARADVERRLRLTTSTPVTGAWRWVDDKTVRFRPHDYWPAGTKVSVATDLTGVAMGGGAYGAPGDPVGFGYHEAVVAVVDSSTHEMTVSRDGKVVRTVPVTTGKPGFTTRSGTKVILEKEQHVVMDGTTVGIAAGSSDNYHLDVYYAERVTWSGEYLHAAPWSTWAQGSQNVSHGCVGMSTDNAKWFFSVADVGDVVKVINTGSAKTMETEGNGFGDWNVPWDEWVKGSATGELTTTTA